MARTCRSCDAAIEWGRIGKNGKPLPLDAEPVALKVGVLYRRDREDFYRRVDAVDIAQGTITGGDGPFYVTHFATCPNAGSHRKGARG